MPPLLSRIEREYIISSLCSDLPELTVVASSGIHTVRDYHCDGTTLTWNKQPQPDTPLNGRVKILFSHKQRILSFTSELRDTIHDIFCPISADIFPEDRISQQGIRVFFPDFSGSRYAEYPAGRERISRNTLTKDVLSNRYEALGEKAGLGSQDYPALASLGNYLEQIKSGDIRPPAAHDCAQIVHCDHEYLLVVFPAGTTKPPDHGSALPVRIHYDKRVITGIARCVAYFRVTAASELLVSRIDNVQEEDKRLLFEMRYTEKYTGNE